MLNFHCLTVRFDLSDCKLLVIGQFGTAPAKLSNKQGLLRTNQIRAFCYYQNYKNNSNNNINNNDFFYDNNGKSNDIIENIFFSMKIDF